MLVNKWEWAKEELDKIKDLGIYRELKTIESSPDPTILLNNQKIIMAASNNYLGLATDSRIIETAIETMQKYGVGSGGARLTTGNTILHDQLEKKVATFKGTEAAIIFSSGYLANIGVISSLASENDVILSDELNHASLIDGCRLSKGKTIVYKHSDLIDLEAKLKKAKNYKNRFIVTDGVFSMDGDIAPLPELITLARKYDAYLIVDDAHGTGILGENGSGIHEYFNTNKVDVLIGTFSKAVGTEGAYVAGSQILINYLRNKARSFIFQTSLPPSIVAATITSLDIIKNEFILRERLKDHIEFVRSTLKDNGFNILEGITPIIPVIIGDEIKSSVFAERLLELGIFAPAIRPPTVPNGQARIRLTLMASHTKEQLNYLCQSFEKVGKELGVI